MKYNHLIDQQRPASSRPKMSAVDRAAQFSAFAALVGLDEQMDETARLVGSKIELSEDEVATLNKKFQILTNRLNDNEDYPNIKVTCFVPDLHKEGGSYITKICTVKQIDDLFFKITLIDRTEINISDILDFEIID